MTLMLITPTGKRYPGYQRARNGLYYKQSDFTQAKTGTNANDSNGSSVSVRTKDGKLVGHFNYRHWDMFSLKKIL